MATSEAVFNAVFPISGDAKALPVKDIGPAVGYYVHVLGFTVINRDEKQATLKRDSVEIGLTISDENPENVSVYFAVSDVEALRREYDDKGISPTELRTDTHDGKSYRVFFAKEPYGVCFCFGQPAS
ncbi:MAG: hypothetical protein OHK0029_22060 [Armatimonadaceae bacterium]